MAQPASGQIRAKVTKDLLQGGNNGSPEKMLIKTKTAAMGIRDAHPGDIAVIVVGSSSHAMHRVVGSVAVSLARRSAVPLVVVP